VSRWFHGGLDVSGIKGAVHGRRCLVSPWISGCDGGANVIDGVGSRGVGSRSRRPIGGGRSCCFEGDGARRAGSGRHVGGGGGGIKVIDLCSSWSNLSRIFNKTFAFGSIGSFDFL
jgi:hypothetical protein